MVVATAVPVNTTFSEIGLKLASKPLIVTAAGETSVADELAIESAVAEVANV